MNLHPTLVRQISKYLGALDTLSPENHVLFEAISATYVHFDEDRQLIERSLELSSKELSEYAARLKATKESIEQQVIERTKQLAFERARLQASINGLALGYILTGTDDEIVLINTSAEDILTLATPTAHPTEKVIDVSELRGKIDMKFLQTALLEHVDIQTQIADAKRKRANIILKDILYKMLYLNIYITPVVYGDTLQVLGAVVLLEDITEQRLMERSRDEFFSIASHELRTPLTAIRGNASMIEDFFISDITNPDVREMIADIHTSSLRLIDIVNDFLDLSRLEQRKMQYESEVFDIVKLCQDVIKEYDVTGSRKKLYLRVDVDPNQIQTPIVYADKNKIRQIIVNLLGNAIKFTDTGGITIAFEMSKNLVKVKIQDTGKGISTENIQLLFRKFQQAQSNILTRDNTKGTGLGLYISKLMAKGMGGDVLLEHSELGKGSIFSVSMPVATDSQKKEMEAKNE